MKSLYRFILGTVLVGVLMGCASQGKTNRHARFEFTPTLQPHERWSRVVGQGSGSYFLHLTPVVNSQGVIFVSTYGGMIEAINLQTGRRIWQHRYEYNFISGLALGHGFLFVGTSDGHMLAIQQSNGRIAWSVIAHNQMLAAPETSSNLVFSHTTDGVLSAYVITTGELSWQQREQQPQIMLYLGSQPRLVGETLLCGFANGRLVAYRASDGHILWSRQVAEPQGITDVSRMVDITSRPVAMNHTVYVVNYQGNLMALHLDSGKVIWQHKLSAFANIAVGGNRLYLSDSQGDVWAFDARTGAVVWRQIHLVMDNLSAPAMIGSSVVVGDAAGYATWMSAEDGHFLASFRVSTSSILSQPVVSNGKLLIYASSGRLLAYSNSNE